MSRGIMTVGLGALTFSAVLGVGTSPGAGLPRPAVASRSVTRSTTSASLPNRATAAFEMSGAALRLASDSTPNCGAGANARTIVGRYKTMRYEAPGYKTTLLYCGGPSYGYLHLEPHVAQFFGGWAMFNFAIAQTLLRPQSITPRPSNNTYTTVAPIEECFDGGPTVHWTFTVSRTVATQADPYIITAYGSKGMTTPEPC